MKPILLEFAAFGPYVKEQTIDFRDLESKGIFLICGETGSGKTMLLDAMTFALYGKSSGDLRNDFKALRSTQAEWTDTTYVRFVFLVNGTYYRFERRLEPKSKNLSDKYFVGFYTGEPEADGSFLDAFWEPLFENPKKTDLDKKAKELIGLDYDQFRQVIILPQGQFEKLLVSGSDEKEKILTTIFGVSKWQKIADEYYCAAEKRKSELQTQKDAMNNSLEEEGCKNLEELQTRIDEVTESISSLSADYVSKNYEQKRNLLQENLILIESFEVLESAKEKQKNLDNEADIQKDKIKRLEQAKKAEGIRPVIVEFTKAQDELDRRNEILKKSEASLFRVKEADAKNKELLNKHKENESKIEAMKEKKVLCIGKRSDYESISILNDSVRQCDDLYNEQLKEETKAANHVQQLTERLLMLQDEYKALDEERRILTDCYFAGIGSELAQKLEEGKPCPVCGSTTHPHKAEMAKDHVNKQDLDIANDKADKKLNEIEIKRKSKEEAETEVNNQKSKTAELKAKLAAATANLESAKANLLENIDSIDALESFIDDLDTQIKEYADKFEELKLMVETSDKDVTRSKQEVTGAKEEKIKAAEMLEKITEKLDLLIKESGYSSREEAIAYLLDEADRSALAESITAYQTEVKSISAQVKEYETKLNGKEKPDKTQILEEINLISASEKRFASESARLGQEKDRLTGKYESLKLIADKYASQIQEAEEDFVFAKSLRGDTGTGLQRYVLGIMFNSVIHAANQMLELVHGGRYFLVRTDDKEQGSNKRGLGLKAHDRFKDEAEPRFVSTMSGGEKFLISLALSIGLSTVAQKGGMKIEALFIDEGFGSLDGESIEDAMSVLDTVQKSSGVLGIISHVQILQERISSKLLVDKNKGKSTIRVDVG